MTGHPRWRGLDDLFDRVPLGDDAKASLLAKMSAPDRHYHGVEHLRSLWRRHREHATRAGLATPTIERMIACAIAYHDCVYDARRRDNEHRSAEVWLRDSEGNAAMSADERAWVAETIRATQDHLAYRPEPPDDLDVATRARLWMLDIDLTSLGESPDVFARNTALLRREAAHLADPEWRAGQRAFLRRCLDAPRIYRTPVLFALYERRARDNLARYLTEIPDEEPPPA
jgi:predicted metal-dependent HD superfamily phosphohydrolase